MNPKRFARLRKLLLILPRLDPRERSSYLDKVCAGDPEMRNEVESLLVCDVDEDLPEVAQTGGVPRLMGLDPNSVSNSLRLPQSIGPYRILDVLGKGGMGLVYRAEQVEPISREVAIKFVPGGLDQRSALNRFDIERQALALMEHPGIARVFDAGEDNEGRPYFVMELVRGVSITEYCRTVAPPLEDRLRLFQEICHAVQHAHQKGIIHRDLKPSNLLVTILDGSPAIKIIDFGIAKATEEITQVGSVTQVGQLMGTLEYMSPEQATGHTNDINTRSDVYSLGVVLYELVAGALPYETRGKPLIEAVRVIAEEHPKSLRDRGVGPDKDMESIIFKTLEKDPERRYASAAALAEDIDRYLDGQPILSRPPSSTYQLQKLITRNKLPFALAAALFVLSMLFGVTMFFAFQAQRVERARTVAEAEKARQVSSFLREMLSAVESKGNKVTVKDVLDAASIDVMGRFENQPEVEAAIQSTIGTSYTALAAFDQAKIHLEESLRIRRNLYGERHPEIAESYLELAEYQRMQSIDKASLARADSLAVAASELRRKILGDEHPDVDEAISLLASIRAERGLNESADSLYRMTIQRVRDRFGDRHPKVAELLRGWAAPLHSLGMDTEAETALRTALEILQEHYDRDHTAVANVIHDLALVVADPEEKEVLKREHLAMQKRLWGVGHRNTIEALFGLGIFCAYLWRFDEGEPLLREALSITEDNYEPDHELLARASNNLAALLDRKGDYAEAEGLYRRAYRIWSTSLGETHSYTFLCRANLARVLDKTLQDEEAWSLYRKGLALAERTHGARSSMVGLHLHRMTTFLNRRGRYEESEKTGRRAWAIYRNQRFDRWNRAASCEALAGSLHGLGRLQGAEEFYLRADSLYQVGGDLAPNGIRNRIRLGSCYHDQGRWDEAEVILRDGRDRFLESIGENHPEYVDVLIALAALCVDQGRWEEATSLLDECLERLASAPPGDLRSQEAATILRHLQTNRSGRADQG